MKLVIVSAALSLLAVSASAAGAKLTCAGPGGHACSAQHVQKLDAAVKEAAKSGNATLADVKSITLGSDGALNCQRNNGSACTTEQIRSVRNMGAALNLKVTPR